MGFLMRRALPVAALCLGVAACLEGPSPQEQDPAVQGDYDDGDEEHRPGQPCLLCHGEGHIGEAPGEDLFELAGTVYGGIADDEDEGLEGVEVIVTDAAGLELTAVSNRAGNFMVSVDTGVSAPTRRNRGRLEIPRPLQFPLSVRIRRDADEQVMATKIWRNGSCAHCHGPAPDVDSVGRVYLFEEGTP